MDTPGLVWFLLIVFFLSVIVAESSLENSEFIEQAEISGLATSRLKAISRIYCSSVCLSYTGCKGYAYRSHETENCIFIHGSGAREATTIVSDQHSQLYVKETLIDEMEYFRDLAVVYRVFESPTLENGAQLVDGKFYKAIRTDRSHRTWVNLGNLSSVACMVVPESCGSAGGALSVWIKILDCPDKGGIISSKSDDDESLVLTCSSNKIGYNVILSKKVIWATTPVPTEWFHLVLNLQDLNDEWFDIYHNGVDLESEVNPSNPYNFTTGLGVMVIGRYWSMDDRWYSSVIVDEMFLFNRKLTTDEIQILYRTHA